jgi:ABC-type oligopeptide transport system substrate-binding subunit
MAEPPFVSNGPFVLDRWEPEGVTVLRRNPHYHGVFSGNVREVHYYSSTNWEANLRMYERGELDVLSLRYPPTPFMDRVRRRFEAEHVAYSLLVADILGFDTRRPPFDDSRVRQAFAHAVDKETLATVVHNNFCVAGAGGLIPPAMPGHIGRAVLPFDPGRAQRLLAAAGYPNGRGFPKIEWVVAEPAFTPVAEYLRQQWRRVLRVDIPVQATDWTTFFSHFSKSSLSLWVVGWGADYPDPDACLSDGPIQQAAHYDDEVFTSLLADARAVLDQQTRIEAYRQLDRLVCEEAVIVPLTYGRMHMLVKPSVAAFPFSPLVFWRWKDVVLA